MIIEMEVFCKRGPCFRYRCIGLEIHLLILDRAPQPLERDGVFVNRKRIQRLMQVMGIVRQHCLALKGARFGVYEDAEAAYAPAGGFRRCSGGYRAGAPSFSGAISPLAASTPFLWND